uniref:Uncharacterized protein n=1 Tax=Quercus lobata TaxID=97700 RepID=A0A7N2MR11_QUELO
MKLALVLVPSLLASLWTSSSIQKIGTIKQINHHDQGLDLSEENLTLLVPMSFKMFTVQNSTILQVGSSHDLHNIACGNPPVQHPISSLMKVPDKMVKNKVPFAQKLQRRSFLDKVNKELIGGRSRSAPGA